MKFYVEWHEASRKRAVVEAPSEEAIRAEWDQTYNSEHVDSLEAMGEEIDGGIEWDTIEIKPAPSSVHTDVTIP